MAVYVDDAEILAEVCNGSRVHRSRWSHLTADTPRELHDFATRVLGLRRSWFQDHWPYPHYDLTAGKRAQALANGAVPVKYGDPEALDRGRWLPPLLVTASRDGADIADVEAALRPHFDPRKILISGGARGGDRIAESLWQAWGGEIDRHAVSAQEWRPSRGAGYERNAAMVAKALDRGGECVAIIARCGRPACNGRVPHGSHGAVHCARIAEEAGLPVTQVKAGTGTAESTRAQATPAAPRHGRYYPPDVPLPGGICPGCRSAALTHGREVCQACGVLRTLAAGQTQSSAVPASPQREAGS